MAKVAIIGGSGVRDCPLFNDLGWKTIDTGYVETGFASDESREQRKIVEYQEGDDVIFIPRHGHNRVYGPSRTPYGANVLAAKILGADRVIATSAVGSLKPWTIGIEELVIPDDYIDETGREDNFFGQGIVVHANPRPAFSKELRELLLDEARKGNYFKDVHDHGTYVAIPGDRFGTSAEGRRRAQYADIVGMTLCPEAALALQLDLHYACAAFPVDVDTDANHEGQTLAVMQRLSADDKVPAYITHVVERALELSLPERLLQLEGNLIPGKIEGIENEYLRTVAQELIEKYCK